MNCAQRIVFIVGPTASGKTAISLELARRIPVEIISADSMQVYRGMDIGTDKVDPAERDRVPHHVIDIRDPSEAFSAFDFRSEALAAINKIHQNRHLPLVVGGSGLYLKSIIDGLAPYPRGSEKIRRELRSIREEKGLDYLYEDLKRVDPVCAERIHPNDERRIVRGLEIFRQLNIRPSALGEKRESLEDLGYSFLLIGIGGDRRELYRRVNERVDAMIGVGLVDEVMRIKGTFSATTGQAVGYKEIVDYAQGKCTLSEAIDTMKKNTRRLVKKQLTWFRKEKRIQWVDTESLGAVSHAVDVIEKIIKVWLERY